MHKLKLLGNHDRVLQQAGHRVGEWSLLMMGRAAAVAHKTVVAGRRVSILYFGVSAFNNCCSRL
jgi:hypothetical protein